jgi:hypothetical protein
VTEVEWLAATDPTPMLEFVQDKVSDRKLRLFAVASCRRISRSLAGVKLLAAIDTAEQFADDVWAGADLRDAEEITDDIAWERETALRQAAMLAVRTNTPVDGDDPTLVALAAAARAVGHTVASLVRASDAASEAAYSIRETSERTVQASFVRDIFGNPFRLMSVHSSWLTSTVTVLAQQMYDSRDFSAMPILADALQDASCDNEAILTHCRGSGPHVRGCWAIDLLIGRE